MKSITHLLNFYPLGSLTGSVTRLGLSCLIALTGIFCQGQNRKDNLIIIKGYSFQQVVQTAIENNFHPSKVDTVLKFAEIPVGTGQTIYITENKCGDINVMSDYIAAWLGNNQRFQVVYMTASYNQGRWNEVMKLVKLFPNLTYTRI